MSSLNSTVYNSSVKQIPGGSPNSTTFLGVLIFSKIFYLPNEHGYLQSYSCSDSEIVRCEIWSSYLNARDTFVREVVKLPKRNKNKNAKSGAKMYKVLPNR